MKTKLLVATALVVFSFSPALVTPAFAITPEAQAELQSVCEAALNPDDAAEFNTEPTGVSEVTGAEFLQSSVVLSSTPGGVLLSQTSVYAGDSTRHRHGGSPNIFGGFTVTSVYSGGSSETLNTYAQTTTYTFGCRVWKDTPGGTIEPNGLQIPVGLSSDETLVTRTETVTVNNPNTTEVTSGDGVICISPNKNPGVWRNQNGYTGPCNTTLFYSLAGIPEPISSNSLPPA